MCVENRKVGGKETTVTSLKNIPAQSIQDGFCLSEWKHFHFDVYSIRCMFFCMNIGNYLQADVISVCICIYVFS